MTTIRTVTRYLALYFLIAAIGLSVVACNAKDTAVDAILALQTAAIGANNTPGANGQPSLSNADTARIVTFTTQALVTMQAGQSGWQSAVKVGWASFIADLPSADQTRFAASLSVLSAAIGAL